MCNDNLIIHNAFVITPIGTKPKKGSEMNSLYELENAVVVCKHGKIVYIGDEQNKPELNSADDYNEIDAEGCVLMPGFVDSHTHLIFGGLRPDEFEWRMKGDSYMSIMERGGGIQSTVNATRSFSLDDMIKRAEWFVNRMVEMGVTTVEAKSGYGLETATELRMLEAINALAENPDTPLNMAVTFLGAHAVPKEYKGRTAEYIQLMKEEMIPAVKGKARFFDIFTEKNVFEIEESRELLTAAKEAGFELKLHADEIVTLGGAELAAEMGAVSADHLLHISDEGIKALASSDTVATLLPLTAFSLKEEYAPARKLIDGGAAVALATDLNPGSCFSGSIPLTIALACIYMGMTIPETITALTLNGAAACGMSDVTGTLEVGKNADMILLHFDNYKTLPYYVGMNCVKTVISRGRIVAENN